MFQEWRERRKTEAALLAKKRRAAANKPKPAPPPPPIPEAVVRIAIAELKLTTTAQCQSNAGVLCAGSRVRVLEWCKDDDGHEHHKRCRVALASDEQLAPLGWVSSTNKDGSSALVVATRQSPAPENATKWIASLSSPRRTIEEAWLAALDSEQFRVLRMRGTEDAYSGNYTDLTESGVYQCAACDRTLYTSKHKFHSACGWASFCDNVEGSLERIAGRNVEIACKGCGGHVGHVFKSPFHPPPHQERHCVNSVSLKFVPDDSASVMSELELCA